MRLIFVVWGEIRIFNIMCTVHSVQYTPTLCSCLDPVCCCDFLLNSPRKSRTIRRQQKLNNDDVYLYEYHCACAMKPSIVAEKEIITVDL